VGSGVGKALELEEVATLSDVLDATSEDVANVALTETSILEEVGAL
jgi:hypothetical protein